jgi:hypothetical protein
MQQIAEVQLGPSMVAGHERMWANGNLHRGIRLNGRSGVEHQASTGQKRKSGFKKWLPGSRRSRLGFEGDNHVLSYGA